MGNIAHFAKLNLKYDPEMDDGKKRPIPGAVAVGDPTDKFSENPSEGLTAVRLAQIFHEANEGNVREQMELFEEMEEKDSHLSSQLQTRKLAVTGLDYEIEPFSEDEKDIEIAEFISEQLASIENLDDVFMDLLDAIGKGISIAEIMWGIDSLGHNIIKDVKRVHQKKLLWDCESDEMKICTRDYPSGISLPCNKFVVHRYKARSGHSSRSGVLRVVSWMYLFKNYDVKDWVSFCEVFGMPLRLGKYDPSASEEDKKALMRAIVSLGADAAGIISKNTEIEFVEANKTSSIDIYEKLARYCDEQMSKAIVGQTLSSDSGGGSYAQGKVHNEVRHDLTVADAKSLSVTVRRDIIKPLVLFNFGADANIPKLNFDYEDTEGLKDESETLKNLQAMGLKIPSAYLYAKFRIPKPEDNEDVLVLPQVPMPATENENISMKLKSDAVAGNQKEQGYLDDIVSKANASATDILQKLIEPIINKVDKMESPETLLAELKDEKKLSELYEDMDEVEFSDLVHQANYIATLIGRMQEDG